MTKLLILSPDLKHQGGVSNFITLLSKELQQREFEIKYIFIGKTGRLYKDVFYPLLIFINFIQIKKILKQFQPDIVQLNPSLSYLTIFRELPMLKIIKQQGYPVVFFIHGWKNKLSNKFENFFCKNFLKKRFQMADAIIVLAREFKDKLLSLEINSNKIYVCSTMVDSLQYSQLSKNIQKPYTILFCSSMIKSKGPYELLNAIPLVIKKHPETFFNFIGDGKELNSLKTMAKKIGSDKNINFMGYKTGTEKIDLFKKAHIFVLPSFSEGFPLVVLEAMAAGLPLVITSVGGLADCFEDGKQGLIIKTKIPASKDIAEKILQLIENPDLMKKMHENNIKEAMEKYDVKIVTKKIIKIYNNILE